MSSITIPVREIREGDQFVADDYLHWTATADATSDQISTSVDVRFGDGGHGERVWDDGSIEIAIVRPEATT